MAEEALTPRSAPLSGASQRSVTEIPQPSTELKNEMARRRFQYDEEALLGSGTFGAVYKAWQTYDDPVSGLPKKRHLAMKYVNLARWSDAFKANRMAYQEKFVMQNVAHPNIVKLMFIFVDASGTSGMEDEGVYIFMERLGLSLAQAQDDIHRGPVPEKVCKIWIKDIASALEYMRSIHICHRDLKRENVMLDGNTGRAKVGDFGFAKVMKHNEHGQLVQFSKSWDKATEIYQAPEIWLRHPFNPFWSDAWALGVLLFKLLNEDYPVDVKKPFNSMIIDMEDQKFPFIRDRRTGRTECSDAARRLTLGLLTADPEKRLKFREVIDHPFCRGVPAMPPVPPFKPGYFTAVRVTTVRERRARSARQIRTRFGNTFSSGSTSGFHQYGRDDIL